MPWARNLGAIWEAQQAGAFTRDRIPEPIVAGFHRRNNGQGATAKLAECIPAAQLRALLHLAMTLPARRLRVEAA